MLFQEAATYKPIDFYKPIILQTYGVMRFYFRYFYYDVILKMCRKTTDKRPYLTALYGVGLAIVTLAAECGVPEAQRYLDELKDMDGSLS